MFAWRYVAFVNCTRRIGPKTFVLFRKIDKDSSGSVSWNTQTNCRTSFHHSHCTFVTILIRLFAGLSPQPACAETSTYCRIYNPILTFGRMPIVTRWFSANTFQEVFARLSIELPRSTPTSEVLFPRRTSFSLCWWLRGWNGLVLHFSPRRARNYTCLLSNTSLLLSIDCKLLVHFQHHLMSCDSSPLHLFQSSHFWRKNFAIEVSDSCFSSPAFQLLIVRHRYFLMNFHVVQF